jgi:gamma-glutamylputrescine oxidase
VDYAWRGTLGLTIHRMPQIGELGPGVWLASGFGGHGLNTTAMAGNLIARAIIDGDLTWRQFTPFELVWAGGMMGRLAGQTRSWIKRLRAAIAERRAKARELAGEVARQRAHQQELEEEQHAQRHDAAAAEAAEVQQDAAADPAVPSAADAGQRRERRRKRQKPSQKA